MIHDTTSPVADRVIQKCGGVRVVSGIVGLSYNHVFKWRHPRSKGGTGGLIPARSQELLMQAAIAGKVDLRPDDFFDIPTEQPVASSQADR